MYSKAFLPHESYEIKRLVVKKDGLQTSFRNKEFGIFISELPLIESFHRNLFVKGDDFRHSFLKGLYNFRHINEKYDSISLVSVIYDWKKYKHAVLSDDRFAAGSLSTQKEIMTYKNEDN